MQDSTPAAGGAPFAISEFSDLIQCCRSKSRAVTNCSLPQQASITHVVSVALTTAFIFQRLPERTIELATTRSCGSGAMAGLDDAEAKS